MIGKIDYVLNRRIKGYETLVKSLYYKNRVLFHGRLHSFTINL